MAKWLAPGATSKGLEFARLYSVGTEFYYYPVADEPERDYTKTRSEPWELGHGTVVVLIEGRTGGVLISHLEPVRDPS